MTAVGSVGIGVEIGSEFLPLGGREVYMLKRVFGDVGRLWWCNWCRKRETLVPGFEVSVRTEL